MERVSGFSERPIHPCLVFSEAEMPGLKEANPRSRQSWWQSQSLFARSRAMGAGRVSVVPEGKEKQSEMETQELLFSMNQKAQVPLK